MADKTNRVAGRSLISLMLRRYYNNILRSSMAKLNKPIPVILSDMQTALDFIDIYTQYKRYTMLDNDRTVHLKFTAGDLVLTLEPKRHDPSTYSDVRYPLQIVTLNDREESILKTVDFDDVEHAWYLAGKSGLCTRLRFDDILTSAYYIQELFLGIALINLDDSEVDANRIAILQRNYTLSGGLFIIGTKAQSRLNGERRHNNDVKYQHVYQSCVALKVLIENNWVAATYDNEL